MEMMLGFYMLYHPRKSEKGGCLPEEKRTAGGGRRCTEQPRNRSCRREWFSAASSRFTQQSSRLDGQWPEIATEVRRRSQETAGKRSRTAGKDSGEAVLLPVVKHTPE